VILLALAVYGFHRSLLVFLYYRHRDQQPQAKGQYAELPAVTVQLPLFNEMYVVERLLESVATIRYLPRSFSDPGARRFHRRDAGHLSGARSRC